MDPRDRLWVELIYPRCGPPALLALRAVCRAFRAQLNNSRLWLPFTMVLPQLRYDERISGWRGVERAMEREANTRANCDAGRYTCGPVVDVDDVRRVMYVAGRIVVFCFPVVHLFDLDTGARVGSFEIDRPVDQTEVAVDRWIPFATSDDRVLLLDCVAARLVEVAPTDVDRRRTVFSVAGPCVSYRMPLGGNATVVHICGGPNDATIMREITRVRLAHKDQFELCERGRSYLLRDFRKDTLQLFDIATDQIKRTFTPRACPPTVLCCAS